MIMNYSHNISCETTDKKEVGDQKLVFGHSALPLLDVFTLNTVSSSVKQKGRVKDWEGNHRDSQSNRIPLHLSNRWVFPCQVTLDCCRWFSLRKSLECFFNGLNLAVVASLIQHFSERAKNSVCGPKRIPQDAYGVEVEAQVLAEHVELPRRHRWLWRQAGRGRDAAVGPAGREDGTS